MEDNVRGTLDGGLVRRACSAGGGEAWGGGEGGGGRKTKGRGEGGGGLEGSKEAKSVRVGCAIAVDSWFVS